MDVEQLTAEQRQELQEQIRRQLRYLGKLRQRMERRGWGDDVYRAVVDAYNAVHALRVKLHYACCEAGKRERAPEGAPPPAAPGERPGWMGSYGPG